jgi:hypothetical protein
MEYITKTLARLRHAIRSGSERPAVPLSPGCKISPVATFQSRAGSRFAAFRHLCFSTDFARQEFFMRALSLFFLLALVGCGNVRDPRLSQSALPNSGQLSVSGFINAIQLTNAGTNLGPNSVVTVVTFIPQTPQAGPSAVITFCGDQQSRFVLNTFAIVNFTQAQGCANIVSVNI